MAEIIEIVNSLTGLPERVIRYSHSAQQIDDAVDFVETEKPLRNYRKITVSSAFGLTFSGFVSSSSTAIVITLPFTDMTKKPSVKITGGIIGRYHGGYFSDASFEAPYTSPLVINSYGDGQITSVSIKKQDGSAWGVDNNVPVSVGFSEGTIIEIS